MRAVLFVLHLEHTKCCVALIYGSLGAGSAFAIVILLDSLRGKMPGVMMARD